MIVLCSLVFDDVVTFVVVSVLLVKSSVVVVAVSTNEVKRVVLGLFIAFEMTM